MSIHYFLLVHDLQRHVTEVYRHDDPEEAHEAYGRLEREAAQSAYEIDIVLVGADSLETVKRTHTSYFRDQELVEA